MSVVFKHGAHTLKELAEALGLDAGRHIVGITIEANIKDVTKITVREIMDLKQHGGLCEVVKRYKLQPVEPEASATEGAQAPVKFREFT
jgi:hypothetical protein